ncbi:Hint domain-containing protein [Nonomuraea sp. B19D2]|uniref:Hint domain-containing protein n=1 Tax=Nonomuraea sp. B19D2 TaxID=3159561 RepID=UPI0032DA0D0F
MARDPLAAVSTIATPQTCTIPGRMVNASKVNPSTNLWEIASWRDLGGGTDLSLPFTWTSERQLSVDGIVAFCTDEATEIFTANGWRTFDKLNAGDEVYTLDHETGVARWEPVRAVNVLPPMRRPMMRMEGRGHSSLTTLDHRWPVRHRGNSSWGRRWKTSETLNAVDYIQRAAPNADAPQHPKFADAFVELMAWIWTEGHIKESVAIKIAQSHVVHPDHCTRIDLALRNYIGPEFDGDMRSIRGSGRPAWRRSTRECGTSYWHMNQAASAPFFDWMTRPEKVVSTDFLRLLTPAQLTLYIETSFDGDGFNRRNRLAQTSRARAEAFQAALILGGHPTTLTEINNDHNRQWEVGKLRSAQFAPVQHATNIDARPFKMEIVEYDGVVWCPTTPSGTWLARRSGTVYWTGNTDNETWAGPAHPTQALKAYRRKINAQARVVVAAMTAAGYSIGDPDDDGVLNVAGLDASLPLVVNGFIRP